ncbi:MAG: sulfatase-like hydrolase/transferase [Candidatus Lokiarchaeia archaeon]|nr:sulfatase-like hydrolase/transferase [Candidatus Lokiarchaeia archaeon]
MSDRMNVLLIMTDQHRADMLGCYGNPIIKTPNIDRFANENVRFTNAFCTNPMCMPNRATILTGYYPNVHGVRSNGINLPTNIPTITQTLVKRGYHTINVGKTHFNFWTPPYNPKGSSAECFDNWKDLDPKKRTLISENFPSPYYGFEELNLVIGHGCLCLGHYHRWLEEKAPELAKRVLNDFQNLDNYFELTYDSFIPEEFYNTTYIKNHTIQFLERFAEGKYEDKPFYFHCSFPDPHYPVCPPGKYRDMYKPENMELPLNFHNIENLYEHPYLGKYMKNPPMRKTLIREETEEIIREFIAFNYGSVTLVDHAIGQILASLEKLGLSDNTMVIFTSDHGDYMGDHSIVLKGPSPFSGTLHVPLIWKIPGLTKAGTTDALISSVDIPETILDLLKIKERYRPPRMQGHDMTSVLKDTSKKVRENVLIVEDEEVGPKGPLYTRLIHLITEDYKLTTYAELPGYGDIYNRKNDKGELNNLWDKDKSLRLELLDKLLHEYMITRSRFPIRQGGT